MKEIKIVDKIKNNLVSISVVMFIIGSIAPFVVAWLFNCTYGPIDGFLKVENVGSVGDFLAGTMNPFFTIAAFCMLVKSYFLQKEELAATREEMKASAESLNAQLAVMKDERKLAEKKQVFDTFLQLHNAWRTIKKDTRLYSEMELVRHVGGNLIPCNSSRMSFNINEYGIYLERILTTCGCSNNVGGLRFIRSDQHAGARELEVIQEQFQRNLIPYLNMLLYLMNFAIEHGAEHPEMLAILGNSISFGERYLLKMYLNDNFRQVMNLDIDIDEISLLKDRLSKLTENLINSKIY